MSADSSPAPKRGRTNGEVRFRSPGGTEYKHKKKNPGAISEAVDEVDDVDTEEKEKLKLTGGATYGSFSNKPFFHQTAGFWSITYIDYAVLFIIVVTIVGGLCAQLVDASFSELVARVDTRVRFYIMKAFGAIFSVELSGNGVKYLPDWKSSAIPSTIGWMLLRICGNAHTAGYDMKTLGIIFTALLGTVLLIVGILSAGSLGFAASARGSSLLQTGADAADAAVTKWFDDVSKDDDVINENEFEVGLGKLLSRSGQFEDDHLSTEELPDADEIFKKYANDEHMSLNEFKQVLEGVHGLHVPEKYTVHADADLVPGSADPEWHDSTDMGTYLSDNFYK